MTTITVLNRDKVPITKTRLIEWLHTKGESQCSFLLRNWFNQGEYNKIRNIINECMCHDIDCDFIHIDIGDHALSRLVDGHIVFGYCSLKDGLSKQEINRFKLKHPARYRWIKTYFRIEHVDDENA